MNILVINCGSSSIKSALINAQTGQRLLTMSISRILDNPLIEINGKEVLQCMDCGHSSAFEAAIPLLLEHLGDILIHGIGHRVVHGGDYFDEATLIDTEVEYVIKELSELAPLHNPVNLLGIQQAQQFFPDLKHIAVFDTAFHQTLPNRAKTYAIPKDLREKYSIRRYGFHGTSHEYVAQLASKYLYDNIQNLRLITCHLGNGCSLAAIEYGRSIETSMGMTPLEGLVMGTRSGDIDAGILLYLKEKEGLTIEDVDDLLNKKSGLKGLSNATNDMRDIIAASINGDDDARLALQVFCHRVRKYIGAYAAVMGGVDAIIFTGGIGENSPIVRHRITQRLDFLGAIINEDKNHDVQLSTDTPIANFAMNHSRVKLLAIKTDEQYAIAQQTAKLLEKSSRNFGINPTPTIPVAVSARHMHITKETLEQLFGEGHELTVHKWLSQPGQFAAKERVTIVGPKNQIERVRILGPCRSKNQIEISRTDEFFLGIDAPIRQSGHTTNSPGCKVIGPKGAITLKEGVICAWRHIHMTPDDAKIFGVNDKDIVDVGIKTDDRSLVFGNVLVRVSPKYALEMHIDTDEGNAAEISRGAEGVLIATDGEATLKKKKLRKG